MNHFAAPAALRALALSVLAWSALVRAGAAGPDPAGVAPSAQAFLPLNAYLEQVRAGNHAIRSAHETLRALDLSIRESENAFSPNLNLEASRYDNEAQNANPSFQGERTLNYAWMLGLSKRWSTGTLTTFGYRGDWSRIEYPDGGGGFALPATLSTLLPSSDPYYTSAPSLTVSQPLWRDFLARGLLASVEKARASAASAQALSRYRIQQTLFAAEQTYVQLALARTTVNIQAESLARNRRILAWAERREAQNLSDRVDTLQTQAAVKQVELGLAQAWEDLRNTIRQFNSLRGHDGAEEAEPLAEFGPPLAQVVRRADRQDLVAARQDLDSKEAAIEEVTQRYTPDLSVYGTASLNGRERAYSDAFAESFTTRYPVTTVGVKLSANLDLPLIGSALEGVELARKAGAQELAQKRLDLERDWHNLEERWTSVTQRLATATELESLQKEKAEREKVRFQNGRTTNYQVLRFEDDYAQARLQRLRLLGEAQLVAAQARLYNGELEP